MPGKGTDSEMNEWDGRSWKIFSEGMQGRKKRNLIVATFFNPIVEGFREGFGGRTCDLIMVLER